MIDHVNTKGEKLITAAFVLELEYWVVEKPFKT